MCVCKCVCASVCVRACKRMWVGAWGGWGELQVILASSDSSLKAGIVRSLCLKMRIDRIVTVHYASFYDAVMRQHRKEVRARRKST